ncbi:DUF5086 family protein [Phyllobacterium sp. YR531]|uniref:DUF5086 family protein n=1 Tax=Phyllobacterium sp. YR531 TaxID=1144343 RepID=UPI00026F4994|nr:DUF5086 family protein [Phyllobacterium sp. YR531]EJN03084.1 hypothetical protein PMI41_02631 [Phyllobacterium sp. YR531]
MTICLRACAGLLLLWMGSTAFAAEQDKNLVLSVTPHKVRWAAIYNSPQTGDPFYHVQVFEKDRGTKPWVFKLLALHLVVTPQALAASRSGKQAKVYQYKDVEFRLAYDSWLNNPGERQKTPVCRTSILDCVKP